MVSRAWMMTVAGLLALVGGVGGLSSALAQESLLPLPLERMSIADALAKSKRERRILIVVREWKRPPQGRRPWWVNDSVRAWIAWHAVLVEVQPEDPEGKLYFNGVPRNDSNKFWGVDVFIDGEHTRLLKCSIPRRPVVTICRLDPCDPEPAAGPDDHGDGGPCVSPTGAAMLGQFDLKLMAAQERDPLWAELHKSLCPEPLRPGRVYWYGLEKDGLPRTTDLTKPAQGDRYIDVFARVREADALAAAGKKGEALALLQWAWERGGEVDPAFALARVGVVLPRMIDLRLTEPAAAKRMEQLAEAELALYPWFDDHEELGYLCLRWAGGDKENAQVRMVVENIDLDEETMGGIVSQRLGDIKGRIAELSQNVPIAADQWRGLMKAVQRPLPRFTDQEPRKRWNRARIELLTIGAVRQYGLLLQGENPADRERANQVAEDALKAAASSEPALRASVLRAMAFAALSVGKSGPTQAAWLDEAAKLEPLKAAEGRDPLMRAISSGK